MEPEFLKTLWLLRFEKLRKLEEESAWAYQDIYDQCLVALGENHELVRMLKQLIKEERHHEKLAEELIQICKESYSGGNDVF